MNHLTIDEIIEFVSSGKADVETLQLISTVNQHIRKCPKCLRLVRAFQMVHDEFVKIGDSREFENYLYNVIKKENTEKFLELKEAVDEYDGLR